MKPKELLSLWQQYQTWLKSNNITQTNIQEKLPEFVGKIKENPEDAKKLQNFLLNPATRDLAQQLKISDTQLNSMKELINQDYSKRGNLTPNQIALIKNSKK